jgi:hypothetical protein
MRGRCKNLTTTLALATPRMTDLPLNGCEDQNSRISVAKRSASDTSPSTIAPGGNLWRPTRLRV